MKIATAKNKHIATEILTSAFINHTDENSINHIVKQDSKRKDRTQLLMEYLVEQSYMFGEIFISDNNQACLLLSYSEKEKISLKSVFLDIKLAVKCIGIFNVHKVLKRQAITKKYYPKEKHIKPVILGVKHQSKGKGIAPRLMVEVRNHFKGNTLPVVIDTTADKNVKMYEKFKFRVVNTEIIDGVPVKFMRLN